jgi:putative exosortase-associated protein (TIGR04073 family)
LKNLTIVLTFLIAFVISGSLFGQDQKVNKAPERSVDAMGIKMVRGITNMATGWGEFPRQIYRSGKEDGVLLALPYGLARGLTMTFLRTMYGVAETVFFFIPFDGGYESSLNPAYVWEVEAPPTPPEPEDAD